MDRGKWILAGVAGGITGAVVMGMMMAAGKEAGMVEAAPPLQIERRLERRAGVAEKTAPEQEVALASAGHLLLGALFGAGYGLLREPLALRGPVRGAAYGLGVYAANYAGLGPALDLVEGPWDNEWGTVAQRVLMHLLFGAVTAGVAEKLVAQWQQR